MPETRSPLTNLQFAAARLLATAWLELRLNVLSPAPWIVGAILAAFAYLAVRFSPDQSSFPLAWVLSAELGPFAGVLLLFLAGSLANRPVRYDLSEIQDSKIVASEELLLGRWLGMVATLLVPLGIEYAVTIAAQKIHAKPAIMPLAYLLSLWRVAPSVLFLSTVAFCLVSLTRVLILGAGLAGLIWFALYFGHVFYPTVLRIDLSQNSGLVWGMTAAVLVLTLLGYGGRRRPKKSLSVRILGSAAVVLLAATIVQAGWAALALPGKGRAVATWRRLRDGRRERGDPPPNFAWVDQRGRRISLASLRGRPALLVFFRPRDGGLLPLLQRLAALRREFAPRGFEAVAICFSEDLNAGAHAAMLARADLPVATDWGVVSGGTYDPDAPASVVSWALKVSTTPMALLVDEEGKELARGLRVDEDGWEDLKQKVDAVVRGEELPPSAPAVPQGIPM